MPCAHLCHCLGCLLCEPCEILDIRDHHRHRPPARGPGKALLLLPQQVGQSGGAVGTEVQPLGGVGGDDTAVTGATMWDRSSCISATECGMSFSKDQCQSEQLALNDMCPIA